MARNKREQDRDSKREEIIAAARQLFIEDGYENTSMSRLAASAGVAANTIYWYFTDKDDVLVAVLDAELARRLAEFQQQSWPGLAEMLEWSVRQLELTRRLVSTVHARLAHSASVHDWHERFHAFSESMIRVNLSERGWPPERVQTWITICVFSIEGMLSHPVSESERRRICQLLASESTTT